MQSKVIGRMPTDHGPYVPGQAYGKKFCVELFGCVWESKHDNNNTAPATLNTQAGTITPNTTDWKKVTGSTDQWLIDNGYKNTPASHVTDSNQDDKTQQQINAEVKDEIGTDSNPGSVKGRIKSLENSVGTGGSVDQRIAAVVGNATSEGNTLEKLEDRLSPVEEAVGSGGSVDSRIANAVGAESTRAQAAEELLDDKLELLNGSEVIVVADHDQVSSPDSQKIYREQGSTSYTDWMYNGGSWKEIATYSFPGTDDVPTTGSNNLVKSGGVYDKFASVEKNTVVSFIRQTATGLISFLPTKFFGTSEKFEVEIGLKMPTDVTSSQFLLTWMTDSAWSGFMITGGYMRGYYKGTQVYNSPISQFAGKKCKLTLTYNKIPNGSLNATLSDGQNTETVISYNVPSSDDRLDSNLFFGSYVTGSAPSLADLYYFVIKDGSTIEVHNASNIEHTADVYIDNALFNSNSGDFASKIQAGVNILKGNVTLNAPITLPNNTHIIGNGCTLKYAADTYSITLTDDCSIESVKFDGQHVANRQTVYEAHPEKGAEFRYELEPIVSATDAANYETRVPYSYVVLAGMNASLINCTFDNMDMFVAAVKTVSPDNSTYNGVNHPSILNCYFNNCRAAVDNRAEFSRIVGCEFHNCPMGLYAKAGNLNLSACHFVRNDIGIILADGGNSGHSQYSGIECAHCGLYGLYSVLLTRYVGLMITGSQFSDAPVVGKFGGLGLVGCRLNTWFLFQSPGEGQATGDCNFIHDCAFDISTVVKYYGDPTKPTEYEQLGLEYLFQLSEDTTLEKKNNVSLNPRYLPSSVIND